MCVSNLVSVIEANLEDTVHWKYCGVMCICRLKRENLSEKEKKGGWNMMQSRKWKAAEDETCLLQDFCLCCTCWPFYRR